MPTDFSNTVFIVTGAASGIGREVALQAAGRGAEVIATDCNPGELENTRLLGEKKAWRLSTFLLDVADSEAINTFAAVMVPKLAGRKLVLVNNAGIALSSGDFSQNSPENFERVLNVNLWGTIRMTKAFYPYFLKQNNGHIINLSSVFGLIGVAQNAAYCTSKFGVRGFTESLRMELLGTGIAVTCVHPGGIKTNIVKNAVIGAETFNAVAHEKAIQSFAAQARTTAEAAATQILQAIAKKKKRLVIGIDGKAIDLVSRLFPVGYTGIVAKRLKKAFGAEEGKA